MKAATKTPRRKRRRLSTFRKPKPSLKMRGAADGLLRHAQELFELSAGLDTAVRDEMSEGIAYIVYAAYDTMGIAECVSDFDSGAYIQQKTYEWFRKREYVEWFCAGASTLFKTTPRCFFRFKAAKARSGKATILTAEKVG